MAQLHAKHTNAYSLLPPLDTKWYRRAIKAGIPRNDRHLMGWFKELSEDGQKELIRLREEHEARISSTD